MKQKLFLILVTVSFLFSCSDRTTKMKAPEEPLLSEIEEQELIDNSVNHQNDLYHYPDIISKSAPKLDLIKNKWESEAILCSENENFLLLRKVSNERFIAIGVEEIKDSYSFQFYDFNIDGKILHKSIITNADYSIDNRFNFIIENNSIYYYTKKNDKEITFSYSLLNNIHNETRQQKLDWERIRDWKEESIYISPNNDISVQLSDVQFIVMRQEQKNDTLINQMYDGTWSFRQGVWSADNSKFYFDNSGAVACIWEVDLTNKTLDKIVPDHRARAPIYIFDKTDEVLYCNERCVYVTRKE